MMASTMMIDNKSHKSLQVQAKRLQRVNLSLMTTKALSMKLKQLLKPRPRPRKKSKCAQIRMMTTKMKTKWRNKKQVMVYSKQSTTQAPLTITASSKAQQSRRQPMLFSALTTHFQTYPWLLYPRAPKNRVTETNQMSQATEATPKSENLTSRRPGQQRGSLVAFKPPP